MQVFCIIFIISTMIIASAIPCNSQASVRASHVSKGDVQIWLARLTKDLFHELKPRTTLLAHIYPGSPNKDLSKDFPSKWYETPETSVARGYEERYAWLLIDKHYYEVLLALGTRDFRDDFADLSYDDNGIGSIEGSGFSELVGYVLAKHGSSAQDFVNFYAEDALAITSRQIINMELVLDEVAASVRNKTKRAVLSRNAERVARLWKIEKTRKGNSLLATNRVLGRFVVGRIDGRIQIIYFPGSND